MTARENFCYATSETLRLHFVYSKSPVNSFLKWISNIPGRNKICWFAWAFHWISGSSSPSCSRYARFITSDINIQKFKNIQTSRCRLFISLSDWSSDWQCKIYKKNVDSTSLHVLRANWNQKVCLKIQKKKIYSIFFNFVEDSYYYSRRKKLSINFQFSRDDVFPLLIWLHQFIPGEL